LGAEFYQILIREFGWVGFTRVSDRLIGRLETLAACIMQAQATKGQDIESMATILDYENGRRINELLDKVGKTLEILYKTQCDMLEPDYKEQFKQLVRRVCITGVGYVKQSFVREDEGDSLASTTLQLNSSNRIKQAQHLMRQLSEGEFGEDDPQVEELRQLMQSIQVSVPYDAKQINERLVFDFPSSTSLIPDINCRNLKGFIGCNWVAEEYLLSLDDLNAFFGKNLTNLDVKTIYFPDGQEIELHDMKNYMGNLNRNPYVCVWEVWNKKTKSSFFVCDGYEGYLSSPTPVEPCTRHFWPWFSLTFNDIDADKESFVSPFPPSDVQQMKSAQKEWNRTRNELRAHRKANAPKTAVQKGILSEEDKDLLMTAPSNAIIELNVSDRPIGDVFAPIGKHPIDPACYDTAPLTQDILMSTGQQEADFGSVPPAKKGETATAASIAAQAKVSKSASNVDDLDGLLTELAENGGELLLREASLPVVQRIVGPGAVWPLTNQDDFVNHVYLEVEAASSGRPNQAVEVANWERLAPVLMQMGANPHFIVRETIKRLDDKLDPSEAFPLTPSVNVPPADPFGAPRGQVGQAAPQQAQPQQGQGQPQQQIPNGPPNKNTIQGAPMNPGVMTR
jgi:hypothetical protein